MRARAVFVVVIAAVVAGSVSACHRAPRLIGEQRRTRWQEVPAARAPARFDQPMVSLTFDDGWKSQATVALPALKARGLRGTFYLVTDEIGTRCCVSLAQARALVSAGNEIGSHTVEHHNLKNRDPVYVDAELALSRNWLQTALGLPDIVSFASPFGGYNVDTMIGAVAFYQSHRTIHRGINTPATDPLELRSNAINTGDAKRNAFLEGYVRTLLARTKARGGWAILHFHRVLPKAKTRSDVSVDVFNAILDDVVRSGLRVVTVREGVDEIFRARGAQIRP